MNAVSLTKRELSRLVGTDAKEHQIAWLQAKGWPYVSFCCHREASMSDKPFFWPVTESKIRADDFPQQAITDIGQHQAALEEVERLKAVNADLLAALEYAFIGFSAAPKSLGYEITHIATIRAAIAKTRGE